MLHNERIDVTLPGTAVWRGGRHPLNIVLEEIENIFLGLGYTIAEGPKLKQIITTLANLPKDHPAGYAIPLSVETCSDPDLPGQVHNGKNRTRAACKDYCPGHI